MDNLLEYSRRVKKEADELLSESNIIKELDGLGMVKVGGSYDLDLMYDRDLDIFVNQTRLTRKTAESLLNKLLLQDYFWGYKFYDFVKYRSGWGPKSYYLGLRKNFKGNDWKIDVWLFPYDLPTEDPLVMEIKKMTEDQKLTLLKLKEYKSKKLGDSVRSYKIYEAVFRHGVDSPQSLDRFLSRVK